MYTNPMYYIYTHGVLYCIPTYPNTTYPNTAYPNTTYPYTTYPNTTYPNTTYLPNKGNITNNNRPTKDMSLTQHTYLPNKWNNIPTYLINGITYLPT